MTYELAKKLKDAGFPQTTEFFHEEFEDDENRRYHRPHDLYGIRKGEAPHPEQGLIADPNLEELIVACGKNLECLVHGRGQKLWSAVGFDDRRLVTDKIIEFEDDEPTNAIAHLWLALHKK